MKNVFIFSIMPQLALEEDKQPLFWNQVKAYLPCKAFTIHVYLKICPQKKSWLE